ncbi:MAG TPA: Rho termination factor N-terminal domain-containing protein, partial [Armatimonadota bacterium]|nr:Rho termination factor N-terminal domain-containing protein [Armatimonadota bacterium]
MAPRKQTSPRTPRTNTEEVTPELVDLESRDINDLLEMARQLNIEDAEELTKQDLTFRILESETERSGLSLGSGWLETLSDGWGFLRQTG